MLDAVDDITEMLRSLVSRGFLFTHPRDCEGNLLAIQGVRMHDDLIDVVVLRSEQEAKAVRMPGDEQNILWPRTTLWQTGGQAHSVLVALLALDDKAPEHPRAAEGGCWVPTEPGHATWLRASAS